MPDEGHMKRIEAAAGVPGLAQILERLPGADLNSLLLEVFARRAQNRSPSALLRDHGSNRFARPSPIDGRAMAELTAQVLTIADTTFDCVQLAPLVPMGTCAVMADVDPRWSVAALRGCEAMSDATNALALEAASRGRPDPGGVHLAAAQRVTRAQAYANPQALAHFSLLGLVSLGQDRAGQDFESLAVLRQLERHLAIVTAILPDEWRCEIGFTLIAGAGKDRILPALRSFAEERGIPLREEGRASAAGYYSGFCLHLYLRQGDGPPQQLVDLGTVAWGAKLLSNSRARMVISGAGIDRLEQLRQAR
jgi:hypothetical protein